MNPLIIALEGLGTETPYFNGKYLQKQLLPKIVGAEIHTYSWMQAKSCLPLNQISRKIILIGHSFGAAQICGGVFPSDLTVTIDPRWTGEEIFQARGAKAWMNWYERHEVFNLPGDEVKGAQNFLVKNEGQSTICGHSAIADAINLFIEECKNEPA